MDLIDYFCKNVLGLYLKLNYVDYQCYLMKLVYIYIMSSYLLLFVMYLCNFTTILTKSCTCRPIGQVNYPAIFCPASNLQFTTRPEPSSGMKRY